MKTKVEQGSKGVTTPYEFTREEFMEEIHKAEEGEFIPVEEFYREVSEMEAIPKKEVVLSQEARSDLISISIWGGSLVWNSGC